MDDRDHQTPDYQTNGRMRDSVPNSTRPLLGMTILAVEDSRYASEAMRLLCVRSGARIRRADCLRSARRHLQVYRPSALIVDLGLPDGSGLELIRDLAGSSPRVAVILATSGDDTAEAAALAAGADGFLTKPIRNIAVFQSMVLAHLPEDRRPCGPRVIGSEEVVPDAIAYRDDMALMAETLRASDVGEMIDYVTLFLHGVALSADDRVLLTAVDDLRADHEGGRAVDQGLARIAALVDDRVGARLSI